MMDLKKAVLEWSWTSGSLHTSKRDNLFFIFLQQTQMDGMILSTVIKTNFLLLIHPYMIKYHPLLIIQENHFSSHFNCIFLTSKHFANFLQQPCNCSIKPSLGLTTFLAALRNSKARFNFHFLLFIKNAKTIVALLLIPARQCTSTFPFSNYLEMNQLVSEKYCPMFQKGLSSIDMVLCEVPTPGFTIKSAAMVSTAVILYCFKVKGSQAAIQLPKNSTPFPLPSMTLLMELFVLVGIMI